MSALNPCFSRLRSLVGRFLTPAKGFTKAVKQKRLRANIRRDFARRGIHVWEPANVYLTARLGDRVSIGMFSEVGAHVYIGEDTRVGFGCFIPEGVTIGKNCFIGPRVCFTNDMYPPGHKADWRKTIVHDGAAIGANVTVAPGVTIHSGALIGCGSAVHCNVPANEIWAGNPARRLRKWTRE